MGKKVSFGHWDITKTENRKEIVELEWNILFEDQEKVLLHLAYGICTMPYDSAGKKVQWENSNIRKWLQKDFLTKAFCSEEFDKIMEVDIEHLKDIRNSSPTVYKTKEKVFLLSEREILSFQLNKEEWQRNLMAGLEEKSYGAWWLRSFGRLEGISMGVVRPDGIIYPSGDIRADNVMVVPALYVRKG